MAMWSLDRQLFLLLNADADAHEWVVESGHLLAVHAHWFLLALLLGLALHRWRPVVRPVLVGLLAIAIGSLACELIAMVWDRPRPFENGLGIPHMMHVGSPSFPSSHATAYVALACSFLLVARYRAVGAVLLALAGLVSIARVVVGVHYPLDIAVGVAIGCLAAIAAHFLIAQLPGIANSRSDHELL
ncbi:phosphatase PAP2 family protein [Variovorax saccharolyticus]|uniref:phosphatase PAP2 family protein n=1 Tax=Variovorax saccharolyticus TaxID=3053516 RepID=UPI0025758FCB|nr:phosphatase PAP2 family protein [Variovorax sp. J22R187]MDM0016743.1 phosphatase PAP2 family protein [Variovorax sp. J22R187]